MPDEIVESVGTEPHRDVCDFCSSEEGSAWEGLGDGAGLELGGGDGEMG